MVPITQFDRNSLGVPNGTVCSMRFSVLCVKHIRLAIFGREYFTVHTPTLWHQHTHTHGIAGANRRTFKYDAT